MGICTAILLLDWMPNWLMAFIIFNFYCMLDSYKKNCFLLFALFTME